MQPIVRIDTREPSFDFASLIAAGQPAILTHFVDHWPSLQASQQGTATLAQYFAGFDNGREMDTLLLADNTDGKVGYAETDLRHYNFERRKYPVWAVFQQLLKQQGQAGGVRIALQSAPLSDCLPQFSIANPLPALPSSVGGRLWLGNRAVVPAHMDHADNIALVLAGRRTFTLFPPEQVANLYIGPLQSAPTGAPISLVDVLAPDYARFPRYRLAEQAAFQATLVAGEALFLPALWWHHVQALDDLNLLLNYWWDGAIASDAKGPSPYDAMLYALLAFQTAAPRQRRNWQALFEHFVFNQDPQSTSHIPADVPALQRELTAHDRHQLQQWLRQQLSLNELENTAE